MPFRSSLINATLVAALALAGSLPARAQRACEAIAASSRTWSAPLDTRITLHVRDVSLREALDRVSALSGVQLAYSADVVPVDRRVCIGAEHDAVGDVLATLLRGAGVQPLVVSGRVVLAPGAASASAVATSIAPSDAPAAGMSVLERVVVTGNAVAAPRRPLAVGLEVIDGDQLRRQSLSSMSELLDATVPGIWSWAQPPSSLVAQYGSVRGASSFNASYPKVYIDGVEVANPLLVTELNPEVIDRVEVIRGPQGSALYGSDAISGVINVLTRHDGALGATPAVQLRSTGGAAASAYASSLVPTHEQRASVRVGSNVHSSGLGLLFKQTGALFPSAESRTFAATGDARYVTTDGIYTGTARYFDKRSGTGQNPLLSALLPSGQTSPTSAADTTLASSSSSDPQSVRQFTVSGSAAISPQGIWTHTLLAGVDGYRLDHVADAASPFPSSVDSALRAARGFGERYTIRANSVARLGADGTSPTTLTLGLEHSVLRQVGTVVIKGPPPSGGVYPTPLETLVATWNHDTGILSQLSTSFDDAIFISAGLRLERNDSFSGSNRYPLLPMLGAATVRTFGPMELKLRAAYGKGIRPPQTPARSAASSYAISTQSTTGVQPALDPEEQSGYESGAELYFGRALSVQVTRFDQRATGLIQNVAVGVDTFSRGGENERRIRYQLQNVGEIRNRGWELQGNVARGAFNLSGTYTSVDSRVRTLARGYQGDLRAGDRMLAVPARTASISASWLANGWSAALGASRAMDWVNYDRLSLATVYTSLGAQGQRDLTGSHLRFYWREYDGDTHLRFTGSRDLTRGFALLLTGENLLGGQLGEPDNVTIRQGRTITGGLRASF